MDFESILGVLFMLIWIVISILSGLKKKKADPSAPAPPKKQKKASEWLKMLEELATNFQKEMTKATKPQETAINSIPPPLPDSQPPTKTVKQKTQKRAVKIPPAERKTRLREPEPVPQRPTQNGLTPLQKAFVWTEILGQPKAFRDWEDR